MSLLSGLQNEEIVKAMHVLLLFLQSSPPEQKPVVSVLLLHLDLLVCSLNLRFSSFHNFLNAHWFLHYS